MMESTQHRAVRRPGDIELMSRAALFAWFEDLADREVAALRADQAPPAEDLWTQLAVQSPGWRPRSP
jgi:hypothetical protein